MIRHSRRRFISFIGKAGAIAGFGALAANQVFAAAPRKVFVHHVYFWLNNPESQEDEAKLIEGLRKLSRVKTIKEYHLGKPSTTNRDVIDRSYSVSWMLMFENKADQDAYQTDPIHLDFVAKCSPLWKKVVVYDSEDI